MKFKHKVVIEITTEDEMPLLGYDIKEAIQSENDSGLKRAISSLDNLGEGTKEYVDTNGKIYYINIKQSVKLK